MDRNHLIGGTDAATLAGLGRESQTVLYLRLRGDIEPSDPGNPDALMFGKLAEEGLIKPALESRDPGLQLVRGEPVALASDPRIGASPDFVEAPGGRFHEFKLTGSRAMWGAPGSREVPTHVFCQVQFLMGIKRANGEPVPTGSVVVDVMFAEGLQLASYVVEEDIDVGRKLLDSARDMLARVERGDPPDPATEADARALFLASKGEVRELSSDQVEALRTIHDAQATIRTLEKQVREMRDALIPELGSATELIHEGQTLATFRANREFDESAFQLEHPDLAVAYQRSGVSVSDLRKGEGSKIVDRFMREVEEPGKQTRVLRFKRGAFNG